MYGMINRALERLVVERTDEATWDRVCEAAGSSETLFISMEPYPDEVTYALVGAASKVLELPAETVLYDLGRLWMRYSGEQGYKHLLDAAGQSLWTFLAGLDAMHIRVKMSFPELRPPRFWLENETEATAELHYMSERAGLEPLVHGLLHAVGERFGESLSVTSRPVEVAEGTHLVFHVTRVGASDGA